MYSQILAPCDAAITGPSSVSGSRGSPTFIDSAFATSASVKRSTIGRSTRIRDPQTQIWPVFPKAPRALQKTAVSRSASAKTRFGFLPPSSSETRLTCEAATSRTREPVSMPPVTDTMSTPGCSTIASPTIPPGPAGAVTPPGGDEAGGEPRRAGHRARRAPGQPGPPAKEAQGIEGDREIGVVHGRDRLSRLDPPPGGPLVGGAAAGGGG